VTLSSIASAVVFGALALPPAAFAQSTSGQVSVMLDVLPDAGVRPDEGGAVSELRTRVVLDYRRPIGTRVKLIASGFAEGLVADRTSGRTSRAAIIRPQELHLEAVWNRADLRVGVSRVVWGRLDEFLPTDVVNPQDLSRFFLEGRSEGRMPVGMVRARWLPSDAFALEGIYVPVFRRGRFDQLDEATSPFNLMPRELCLTPTQCVPIAIEGADQRHGWRQAQGGVRANATTGRVDWSLSAYRGIEPLPVYTLADAAVLTLTEGFPRFTMIGADFETVRGEWGVRGEVAAFVSRTLQWTDQPRASAGKAIEMGLGVDRRAGAYRVSANAILTKRSTDIDGLGAVPVIDRTDVTLVGSLDRTFARETRRVRAFAAYNPGEETAFARMIASISVRDNVALEASAGWFLGEGSDALGRLASKDFAYGQLKVFF
jgi:hypothetical protein